MRTTLDLEQILFDHLKLGALDSEISGSIYKRQRVANSTLEDVVIISLPINAEQVQEAVVNVNIHVKNLEVTANGIADQSHPDHARMKVLADLAKVELDDYYDPVNGYFFNVQQQQIFQDETAGDHYVNFRITFNSINL